MSLLAQHIDSQEQNLNENALFAKVDDCYYVKASTDHIEVLKDMNNPEDVEFVRTHLNIDSSYVREIGDRYTIVGIAQDTPNKRVELPPGIYSMHYNPQKDSFYLRPASSKVEPNYVSLNLLGSTTNDIGKFIGNKEIYKKIQAPYRRGYLLHGPPGNGKTSLIRELVSKYKDEAYIIHCNFVPDSQICKALNAIDRLKIIVMEEIAASRKIDVNEFLQFMDGEDSLDNCITIATTNDVHKLAANIANRPSRFDLVMTIGNPEPDDALKILNRYSLTPLPEVPDWLKSKEFSIAQLKEIALLAAIYDLPHQQAAEKLREQNRAFNSGFEEKKTFGIRVGGDD